MICDVCKEESENLMLDKVPSGFGRMVYRQICDDCQADLEDYWDRKLEERKLNE